MKILAVQNRMGIGDMVIFLPFIEAISIKFNTPVSLLVKKDSKADQYIKETNYIDKLIFLPEENFLIISYIIEDVVVIFPSSIISTSFI